MNTINPGEIVYARISCTTIARKGKPAKTLGPLTMVFAAGWDGYKQYLSYANRDDMMIINKFGAQEDLIITKMEVVSRCGYRAKQLQNK